MEEVFFFLNVCHIRDFTVVPNMQHGLQSRKRSADPVRARSITSCSEVHEDSGVSSRGGARRAGAAASTPLRAPALHLAQTFALNKWQESWKFMFLVSGKVYITMAMYFFFFNMYLAATHLHTHTQINCIHYTYKNHMRICKRNTLQRYPISFAICCIMQIYSGWEGTENLFI